MTIEKARDILQEEAQGLSDVEVNSLIQQTGGICDVFLDILVNGILTPKDKGVLNG